MFYACQPVTRCGAIEQQRRNESEHTPFQPANILNICKTTIAEFTSTNIKGEQTTLDNIKANKHEIK